MVLEHNQFLLVVLLVVFGAILVRAWPDSQVTSREYKAMLKASLFAPPHLVDTTTPNNDRAGDNPYRTIPNFMAALLAELEHDLHLAAAAAGARNVHGTFQLKEETPRKVEFFDTPGACHLRSNSWTLRVRTPLDRLVQDDDGEDRRNHEKEATLKSRSGDRYHTTYRRKKMNECHQDLARQGKNKLEEDIAHFDWTGNAYSFSQKCHVHKDYPFETVRDLTRIWYEMDDVVTQKPYEWDVHELDLQLVSNVTVVEWVFGGFSILLSDDDDDKERTAKVSVTLWYPVDDSSFSENNKEFPSQPPIVAEMSYTIKSDDESWSQQTVMTAHAFWNQCSILDRWLDPQSTTKTAWIYAYDKFCTPPGELVVH